MSPQLTYGDIYKAETKTLDLVEATESTQDFNLQMNARWSYGGLSYKHNDFNFSLFHECVIDGYVNIPNQMFELITEGNIKFRDASVDINPSAIFQSHHKWSIGVDYFLDKLMVGIQLNTYMGNAYLNTQSSKLSINFEEHFFEFGFDKDIDVKSSGAINYVGVDQVNLTLDDNALSPLGSLKNLGFGISAQFSYKPNESFRVFGRLDDLGAIRWNNQTEILTDRSYSEFGGLDIKQSYVTGETYSVVDTLYSKIDIEKQTSAFFSPVLHSLFVGFDYRLNDFVSVGALARNRNNGVSQQFFVEPKLTINPFENFNFTLANVSHRNTLLNPKLEVHAELGNSFGFNLVLVNPWKFGRYYDAKMLHASLRMYVKLFPED